jgi:tetratricopeptide (TPR) repeat protein
MEALPDRIARARREGKFQQALDLAHQLYKQNKNEANQELVRQVSLERGQQLESQGHAKDAATLYANIVDMGGPPEFQRQLAEKLASSGAIDQALTLAQRLDDPRLMQQIQGFQVDAALRQGSAGRQKLAAELQPQFDAIVQAFAHAEAGRDEEARTALQLIGLQSPFLEWRVFLRGLLSFYANEDQRALENWQRLHPQRLPARLAAPLRFGIDPAFRAAQPPATQNLLRQQLDKLQGSSLVPLLRNLQAMLTRPDQLAKAFRQAETVVPSLRNQAPDLAPRLAACFRQAIIEHGQPEDLDRYLRVFGPLPDDPKLLRVQALATERRGLLPEAHQNWRDYEKEVAHNPSAWPGDQARHVRALILTHMGNLASEHLAENLDLFAFGGPKKKPPQLFKPSAEECYRRSLELAPEMLATHEELFQYFADRNETKKALQAGQKLIERFPDHAPTLKALANMAMEEGLLDQAQQYLEGALRANPLARDLRLQLSKVHEYKARDYSSKKQFDLARTECQTALGLGDLPWKFSILCLEAMIELKAKNLPRHQERLAQAEQEAGHRLLVAYWLMVESIRQKMTPAQKKTFSNEFLDGLLQPLEPQLLTRLVANAVLQRAAGPAYHGQKTHEKKILAVVEKQKLDDFNEDLLENLAASLAELDASKLLERCIHKARQRFPNNPRFLLIEASFLMEKGDIWQLEGVLKKARQTIEALPRGENQQRFLDQLQELEDKQREMNGPGSFFGDLMDRFFEMDPFGGDEEFDDDDDDGF